MKRSIILILLINIVLILAACSETDVKSSNNNEEQIVNENNGETGKDENNEEEEQPAYDENEFKRPLTNTEQMLLEREGIYSSSKFYEMDLYKKIEQLPSNLTEKDYYNEFLDLLKEDYSHEVTTLINFDDAINVELERPDESINKPINNLRYFILLDASGSMLGQINGTTKMEVAKESIEKFSKGLPADSSISLKVYGHKGSNQETDKQLSCSSTEEVYNGDFNKQLFNESLGKVQPSGWTPIALALESIKTGISENEKIVVYVVSDGIETCGGDPVNVVKELKKSGIDITVNIIGFDIDDTGQRLLKEVSDEGNGEFTNVNSKVDLDRYLRQQYELQQYNWSSWKDLGVNRSVSVSDEKKMKIVEIEKEIKNTALTEHNNLILAKEYLEKTFNESNIEFDKILSLISDRYYQILKYATDTSNSMRSNIAKNTTEKLNEYNLEGNEKVNENLSEQSNLNE
jgi:Ca-activated chloride channel homolog